MRRHFPNKTTKAADTSNVPLANLNSLLTTIASLHSLLLQQEADRNKANWENTRKLYNDANERFEQFVKDFVTSPTPQAGDSQYDFIDRERLAIRQLDYALSNSTCNSDNLKKHVQGLFDAFQSGGLTSNKEQLAPSLSTF